MVFILKNAGFIQISIYQHRDKSENDKQNDSNYITYICSFPRKAIVKSLEVAEINCVHYLKHKYRKTVRLTKTNFAEYVFIFNTFFT